MYTYYVCIYFYILKVRQYNVYMYYTLYHYLYLYMYICIYMYIYVYILSYIHTSRCPAFAGSCQQNTHSYVRFYISQQIIYIANSCPQEQGKHTVLLPYENTAAI